MRDRFKKNIVGWSRGHAKIGDKSTKLFEVESLEQTGLPTSCQTRDRFKKNIFGKETRQKMVTKVPDCLKQNPWNRQDHQVG